MVCAFNVWHEKLETRTTDFTSLYRNISKQRWDVDWVCYRSNGRCIYFPQVSTLNCPFKPLFTIQSTPTQLSPLMTQYLTCIICGMNEYIESHFHFCVTYIKNVLCNVHLLLKGVRSFLAVPWPDHSFLKSVITRKLLKYIYNQMYVFEDEWLCRDMDTKSLL